MFDIGLGEMILIGIIALIAIGPKQLPEVARTVGRLLNELRRATGDFTKTIVDARESTNKMIIDAQRSVLDTVTTFDENKAHAKASTRESMPTQEPERTLAIEHQLTFGLDDVPEAPPTTSPDNKKDS